MADTAPFETHAARYDRWFETHPEAHRSAMAALSRLVPEDSFGLAVGVGSGRFAGPLNIDVGLDPAGAMLDRALDRGVTPIRGVAEALPVRPARFDVVLAVTTVCFVDDLAATLHEARRVLRPGAALVIGYVDADSPLGQRYQETEGRSPFYREATFLSTPAPEEAIEEAGFQEVEFVQTLFSSPSAMEEADPVRDGHGDGSFVGLRAVVPG
ncbi:MAG: class I SAM-dependent methyltransferase [Halobacteriaceae archaeon]